MILCRIVFKHCLDDATPWALFVFKLPCLPLYCEHSVHSPVLVFQSTLAWNWPRFTRTSLVRRVPTPKTELRGCIVKERGAEDSGHKHIFMQHPAAHPRALGHSIGEEVRDSMAFNRLTLPSQKYAQCNNMFIRRMRVHDRHPSGIHMSSSSNLPACRIWAENDDLNNDKATSIGRTGAS